MRYRRLLIAILLLASGMAAQTANVIELSPVDAARAQKAWDTLQKAQTEWKETQKDMEVKYVPSGAKGHCTNTVDGRCLPDEWIGGFEFSKDFKVIVPKPSSWTTGTITAGCPTYNYPYWNVPSCGVTNCNLKYQ